MSDSILKSNSLHEGLWSGHDEAYLILWSEGYKIMIAFYIRKGLVHEAEDLWSQTFIKLLRTRCMSFNPAKGSFEGWLFTVGKNVAIDFKRKQEAEISIDDCLGLAASDSDKKNKGGSRYWKLLVNRAQALLKPDDRTILSLRVVQELSYDSISKELGISVVAATKRVSRALERLYLELERLSTHELPRRIGRLSRRSSG